MLDFILKMEDSLLVQLLVLIKLKIVIVRLVIFVLERHLIIKMMERWFKDHLLLKNLSWKLDKKGKLWLLAKIAANVCTKIKWGIKYWNTDPVLKTNCKNLIKVYYLFSGGIKYLLLPANQPQSRLRKRAKDMTRCFRTRKELPRSNQNQI